MTQASRQNRVKQLRQHRPRRRGVAGSLVAAVMGLVLLVVALGGCGGPDRIVLDVRPPAEFSRGHLQGAHNANIEAPDFPQMVGQFDRGAEVYVYCFSGVRSAAASELLRDLGFTNVTDAGGMSDAAELLNLKVVQ